MQYRKKQTEYAADQIDTGARDNYKVDIFPAMRWLSKACKQILADKIRNCWETTGIVPAYDCDTLAEDNETASEIEKYVRAVDPQSRRATMSDVMNREQEIKVTRNASGTDALLNILLPDKADAQEGDGDEAASNTESVSALSTLEKQVKFLSHVKIIMKANRVPDEPVLSGIRRLQIKIREQRA